MKNITLKSLVKELFLEEGFEDLETSKGEEIFNSYYNTKKAQFDKILEIAGISKSKFKIGKDYDISIEDKELVKMLFEEVNSIYAKGLRLKNPDKYTIYDRFDFLLKIEKRLEKKFKGDELLKQKQNFYGYSNLISQYKVYSIKETISSFLDIQIPSLQVSDTDIKNDKDEMEIQEKKIKALQKDDLKEFFNLVDVPIEYDYKGLSKSNEYKSNNIGFYSLTENDRILVLGLYEKMIEKILEELKKFTGKLSDAREFFEGKNAKKVFIQAIDDYKEALETDGEPMPEECKKAIEELLKNRKKKRATEK
jgi:hypothetical protein